jgi:SAM-dependent methyltransferase
MLGHPDIYHRARLDLSDRAVYWLKTLLKYKRPPGKILELGSGHGGFSALLQWAGFQAMGLEPHAWVSQLSHSIFNVPTLTGRLADQSLEPQSLDTIILFDVLEHLPDPVETLHLCYALLKPDGLILIQTPCVPEGMSLEQIEADQNSITKMLLPMEHLYLYSKNGIQQQLNQTGFHHIVYEKALFSYDMFLVASGEKLLIPNENDPADSLIERPANRLVIALLDLYQKWQDAEADRLARFAQVEELTGLVKQAEADRLAWQGQIEMSSRQLLEIEQDRQARLENNEQLAGWLKTAEQERGELFEQVEQLTGWLKTAESDREARLTQINELSKHLKTAEADRAARLAQVNELSERLESAEADRQNRLEQVNELTELLEKSEEDRTDRLEQIVELTRLLEKSDADRAARLEQIQTLTKDLKESEADRSARLEQIITLTGMVELLQNDSIKAETIEEE